MALTSALLRAIACGTWRVALIHTHFAETFKKDPFIARSDANETYRPKRTKMSLLLGVRDFGISLKVTFVFNFWPVGIFFTGPLGDTVQSAF